MLKQQVEEKKYIDFGAGVENQHGITRTKLNTAASDVPTFLTLAVLPDTTVPHAIVAARPGVPVPPVPPEPPVLYSNSSHENSAILGIICPRCL